MDKLKTSQILFIASGLLLAYVVYSSYKSQKTAAVIAESAPQSNPASPGTNSRGFVSGIESSVLNFLIATPAIFP